MCVCVEVNRQKLNHMHLYSLLEGKKAQLFKATVSLRLVSNGVKLMLRLFAFLLEPGRQINTACHLHV